MRGMMIFLDEKALPKMEAFTNFLRSFFLKAATSGEKRAMRRIITATDAMSRTDRLAIVNPG